MATVNSISLYLARTHSSDSCYVGVGLYAPGYIFIGNTALVDYDNIPHTVTGPSWITFTFDIPVTVSVTGWYVIRLFISPHTNYDMMGLRWYGASDWIEKPAEAPFTGSEHAVIAGTSPTRAYDMSVEGFTANYARETTADWYSQSDNGIEIQTYLEIEPEGLTKPKNPTPADSISAGADFSDFSLGWENGGGAVQYKLYIGDSPLTLQLFATLDEEGYYVSPGSLARAYILAIQGVVYWRVDALDDEENVVTGDIWRFDPRPAKAHTPTPSSGATNQKLTQTLGWEAGAGAATTKYNLYGSNGLSVPNIESTSYSLPTRYLKYNTTFSWRVDAKNQFGTTTGDTWSFTTIPIFPPMSTNTYNGQYYRLLIKEDGIVGTSPADGGVEDVDFIYVDGPNLITVHKYLVAAAKNRIYYEI